MTFFGIPPRSEWLTIVLSPYGEDFRLYTFPVLAAVSGTRTKVFPPRASLGPTDFDADDTLSTVNFLDISGGSGIKVINPSTDLGNTWWHIGDARGTDGWTTPPEAISTRPAVYTGDHVPLGRIGSSTYGLWGSALHRWVPETQTWTDSVGTIGTVVNTEGIATFNGAMYFPLGNSGYIKASESAPGTISIAAAVTGAASPTSNSPEPTSNPRVHAFCVYEQKLWAITTAAESHQLCNSLTGASASWTWPFDTARQTFIKIETSAEPHTTAVFVNSEQQPALWVGCRRGLLTWDPTGMTFQESNLWNVPPHPDFGKAMIVFRPGEALWIVGGGGDLIQYTSSGVVVPASGPGGAKQGMPVGKRGSIVSMASDLANLYMLVAGETPVGESDSMVEDSGGSDPIYVPESTGVSSVISWTGKGFHPLWESGADAGAPTKIVVSDATTTLGDTDYRAFWGVGEDSWSFEARLHTYSSQQAVEQGNLRRFATTGYYEFGEFWAGSAAIEKLNSHVGLFMRYANDANFAEFEYQTDANSFGTWTTLGQAAIENQRVVLPFGLTADGLFSEGLPALWIKPRLRLEGAGGYVSPVVRGFSLAYMPLPQDAATKKYIVPLPIEVDERVDLTAEQIKDRLTAHVESQRFLYLLDQRGHIYRAYVAAIAETGVTSDDASGSLAVTVIQIPSGVPGLLGED